MAFVLTLLYVATTLLSPGAFPAGVADFHIAEILAGLTMIALIPAIPKSRIWAFPETYLAAGLLSVAAFSIVATGWLSGGFYTLLTTTPIVMTYYFVAITCRSLRQMKILVYVLVAVAFFILASGAMEVQTTMANFAKNHTAMGTYILVEGINVDGALDHLLPRYRGMGTLNDPNDLAQFLVTLIPLLWLRWKKGKFVSNILLTLVPAAILCLGIYLTHSRGATFALLAVILFGFKDKIGVIGSGVIALVASAGLLALNVSGGRGMNEDDGDRMGFWSNGLIAFRTHPIFGVGLGNFSNFNNGRVAHNSYISGMAELGLFGYPFWLGLIVCSWTSLSNMIRSNSSALTVNANDLLGSEQPPPVQLTQDLVMQRGPGLPVGAAVATGLKPPSLFSSYANGERNAMTHLGRGPKVTDGNPESAELASAARLLQISMVGTLVTAFFLTRNFAVPFYIMFGLAVSLNRLYPTQVSPDLKSLLKKTGLAVLGSIVLIYVFVRLHHVG